MGQLRHVLKHSARRLAYVEVTPETVLDWVEGEPGGGDEDDPPEEGGPGPLISGSFPCVLFLPLGTEDAPSEGRTRKVSVPTLLWEPEGAAEVAVPDIGADDELLIAAPELAAYFEQAEGEEEGVGRWQVDGRPQPFGPPGRVIGAQARLRQVES